MPMVDSGMNCYGDGGHPAVVDTEIVFGMDWWGNYLMMHLEIGHVANAQN